MTTSTLRALLPTARSLRLAAYCTFVFMLCSLGCERLLHAELGEAALRFGDELGGLLDLSKNTETLLLDGARFHHARSVLPDPPSAVLDRLEHACDARPGAFTSALAGLARRAGARLDRYGVSAAARRGMLRYERGGHGVLVCFTAASPGEPPSLGAALRDFATSRDLTRFGHVRYAYVEGRADGGTLVTSIWSNDALALSSLFPNTGDSAGSDPHVLPRPPGFRRTLSAGAEQLPLGVWLYRGAEEPSAVLAFYEPWLAKHGFRRVATDAPLGASAYRRTDGLQAFVSVVADDGETSVSLVEAGATATSPIASVESED
jgi:hypothetical protein